MTSPKQLKYWRKMLKSFIGIYLDFICKAVFALAVSNLLLVLFFHKTEEFGYIKSFASGMLVKCKGFLIRKQQKK